MPKFQPSPAVLERYAQVLVNFALNSGQGVKPGEVVMLAVPDVAKALGVALYQQVLKSGAHPIFHLYPTNIERDFYTLANDDQLTFFPKDYFKARANVMDHQIGVIADVDPMELAGIDPAKFLKARDAKKEYRDWLTDKENRGQFTWTAALWGVEAKAKIVGLSLEEYWQEIVNACFLDHADPVQKWRQISDAQTRTKDALNNLEIDYVRVMGDDMDLQVKIGAKRAWAGGEGRNIPSFELFTSPDWRGTNGWIRFNQPVYRYGHKMAGIQLWFKDGLVTKATATEGEDFLKEMIKSKNANKLGEFSLTDKSMSRITHPMAETLFDENIGGEFGNMHVALGMAYKNCYQGDPAKVSEAEWEKLGYNDSAEHTDIVSTTNKTVTAYLPDGTSKVIYQAGKFLI